MADVVGLTAAEGAEILECTPEAFRQRRCRPLRRVCAMSLPDDEAERLARFLLAPVPDGEGVGEPALS